MPARSALPRLVDILESIEGIRATIDGVSFEEFERSWTIFRAVERGIEIISEASRHIPDELKRDHPEIPWAKIAGIGNLTRHEYHRIAPDIVWRIVQSDLDPLESAVRNMIDREKNRR
ncbi:MAG: HepT-like ribonuclease domain-containing protein [Rhodovibrionaceae bacterium]|nr:HepT-like ribonuclease domain-containing protein [Rhodovibrionaceae bacterium]